jgi:predicted small metal-binding protein
LCWLQRTDVKPKDRVKSFQCAHAGVPCKAKVTGETDEEVLAAAVEHAREVHGVDLTVSTTLANYARSLIREEAGTTR